MQSDVSAPHPPPRPWHAGRVLRSAAWPAAHPETGKAHFITGSRPGDLSAVASSLPWTLCLDLPAESGGDIQRIGYLDGLDLVRPDAPDDPVAEYLVLPGGDLLGRVKAPGCPRLFQAELDIEIKDGVHWLEGNGDGILLLVADRADREGEFVLLTGAAGERTTLESRARTLLDPKAFRALKEHRSRRKLVNAASPGEPTEAAAYHAALETMIGAVRGPQGPFSGRWCARPGSDVADFNLTGCLLPAWIEVDPTVAIDLLRTVLGCQEPDGRLPARVPLNAPPSPYSAWPVWCRRLQQIRQAVPAGNLLNEFLPPLEKSLLFLAESSPLAPYDGFGWIHPDEAVIPDTLDQHLATVDAAALILCETEAFTALARSAGYSIPADILQLAEQAREQLERLHWDADRAVFLDAYPSSRRRVNRLTLGTLFPLGMDTLLPARRRALESMLVDRKKLLRPEGLLLWQPWPEDPLDPPIPVLQQLLFLETLTSGGHPPPASILQSWWNTCTAHHRLHDRFSRSLDVSPAETNASSPGHTDPFASDSAPPETAALVRRSYSTLQWASKEDALSPRLRWMERRRSLFIGVPLGLLIILILGITLYFQTKQTPPRSTIQSMTFHAEQLYRSGEYEIAIPLLEKVLASRGSHPALLHLLGNNHFKLGNFAQAAEAYQRALAIEPLPKTRYNLALALHKSRKSDEARAVLQTLLEESPTLPPRFRQRVQNALTLLEGKDILDS